ncbi:hypothetical protein [Janibacter hoylei]|uniref:hypothetical protein n=1 Tax=Janibacter hoylei TaxID=364298 RepID=UPI0021A95D0A|nr:hypothetical protein [Janibacter hoylei]MCT1618988.1 hypothetical protein [Janibacter hoylei]MCT2292627.1 hypothetical protein [Janibacter hoylei]
MAAPLRAAMRAQRRWVGRRQGEFSPSNVVVRADGDVRTRLDTALASLPSRVS